MFIPNPQGAPALPPSGRRAPMGLTRRPALTVFYSVAIRARTSHPGRMPPHFPPIRCTPKVALYQQVSGSLCLGGTKRPQTTGYAVPDQQYAVVPRKQVYFDRRRPRYGGTTGLRQNIHIFLFSTPRRSQKYSIFPPRRPHSCLWHDIVIPRLGGLLFFSIHRAVG